MLPTTISHRIPTLPPSPKNVPVPPAAPVPLLCVEFEPAAPIEEGIPSPPFSPEYIRPPMPPCAGAEAMFRRGIVDVPITNPELPSVTAVPAIVAL